MKTIRRVRGTADEIIDYKFIYRFFDCEEYAENFRRGRDIRIGTLEACRHFEMEKRQDKDEGRLTYSGDISIGSRDMNPRLYDYYKSLGVFSHNHMVGFSMSGIDICFNIEDAYVMCCTERYAPESMPVEDQGKHCVRIKHPYEFFMRISERLLELEIPVVEAHYGRAHYEGRHHDIHSGAHFRVGFLKPVDGYTEQQEVRMLWTVDPKEMPPPLKPFNIDCPSIRDLCTLMD